MASSSRFRFAPVAGTSAPTAQPSRASSNRTAPLAALAQADSRTTATATAASGVGQTGRVHKGVTATAANVVDPKGKARATPSTTSWLVKPEPGQASTSAAAVASYHNNFPAAASGKRSHAHPLHGTTSATTLGDPVAGAAFATISGLAHVIASTSTTSSSGTPKPMTVHAFLPPVILGRHRSSSSSHHPPAASSTASPHFTTSRPSAAPALTDNVVASLPPPAAPRASASSKAGMISHSRPSSPPHPSRQHSSRGEKRSQNDPAERPQLESDEIQPADENHDPFRPSASKRFRASLDSGYGAGDRTNHEMQMHGFELVAPTPTVDEPIICDSEGEECEPLTSEADIPTPSTASEKAGRHRLVEAAKKAERAKLAAGPSPGAAAAAVTSGSNEPAPEIVEHNLLRLTNRRIALLEECLELLNSGATFTESGSDEPMLRNNLNYVAEKTQEQRATLLARGRSLSPLQLMLEKRASLLNELIDIRTNAIGVSATGSDRGFVEHQLVYVNSRIDDLRAQVGVTGVMTPRAVASPAPALGTSSNHSSGDARSSRAPARSDTEVVPKLSIAPLPSLSLSDHTIVQPPPQQQPQPRLSLGADVVSGPSVPNSSGSCSSLNSATAKIHAPRPAAAKVTSFRPAPNPTTSLAPAPAPAPAMVPVPTTASLSRPTLVLAPAPPASNASSSTSSRFRPAGDGVAGPSKAPAPGPGRVASISRLDLQPAPVGPIASTSKTIVIEDDFAGINFDEPLTIDDDDDMFLVESTTSRPGQKNLQQPDRAVTAWSTGDVDPARAIVAPKLNHPWSRDVAKALRQRFGLTGFRANQEEAINATLAGKDVFVLLPTGGGKSLCFQLPAVISTGRTKGVTIVVSPLLSLISDQTKALIEKDIPVVFLNSTMAATDRKFAMDAIRSDPPFACLAYVTPEQIVKSDAFRSVLRELSRRNQLARFVIDEAHCVSSWGHDFRPDYKEMGSLKKDFPRVPMIALTATANDRVKNDVMSNLHMQSPLVLTQSFNRKNLRYEVRPKGKGVINDIATLIRTNFAGKCGIIYCMSKKQCEDTAKTLRDRYQIGAQHYHAGMNKDDRLRIQEGWQHNEFHVICATIAFGMGIDKPDVRYVIHYSLSQSLEAYYQETGRAGRDGVTSTCILFYAYGDTKLINRLIDEGEGTVEQKENNRANVRRVVQYCMNETDCRRVQVLRYFGDNDFTADMCHKTCDNCLAARNVEKRDVTEIAQDAIRLVQSIEREKGVTMLYAIDVFRGSKIAKITAKGHDQLPYAGKGAKMERGDVERLFQLLASESALGERFERNALGFTNAYVTVGPKARDLLSGSRKLEMGMSSTTHKRATTTTTTTAARAQKPIAAKYSNDFVDDVEDEDSGDDYDTYAPGAGRDANTYDECQNLTSPAASVRASKQVVGATYPSDIDSVLAQLINLRAETALAEDCEESQIISDDALQRVAANLPCSRAELALIPGCENEELFEWYLESGCRKVCSLARAGRARQGTAAGPSRSKVMAITSCRTLTAATTSKETQTKPARTKPRVSANSVTKLKSKANVSTGATKQMNIERFALGAAGSARGSAAGSTSNSRRGTGRSKGSAPSGASGTGGGGVIRAMPILRR